MTRPTMRLVPIKTVEQQDVQDLHRARRLAVVQRLRKQMPFGEQFSSSRELAAWLGLVPRQRSTGGRTRLLGISKRGDAYLRTLLIHGARAALRLAERKADRRNA